MWRQLSRPEVLVYLDASLSVVRGRLRVTYDESREREQRRRLAHARRHCDVFVRTDSLTEDQVLERVVSALDRVGVRPASVPAEES